MFCLQSTTSNAMNAAVMRPDSGTKHSTVSPALGCTLVNHSASMTKMEAAPVLPRLARLFHHLSSSMARPALSSMSRMTGMNLADE